MEPAPAPADTAIPAADTVPPAKAGEKAEKQDKLAEGAIVPLKHTEPEVCPIEGPRCTPSELQAQRIVWKWPEYRTYQFVLTGVQVAAAFGSLAIPGAERLQGVSSFDEGARDIFRAKGAEGRQRARDASDVALILLINQRMVDDLFVTWWYYDRGDVAWQMALIDAQAITFTTAVSGLVSGIVGRRRPYAKFGDCDLPSNEFDSDCSGSRQYQSYFSGHASAAFTMAGLTCAHHANLPLYGGGFLEGLACGTTIAAASTVALMRVVADQHYMSDVLTGAGVGLLSGLGIPYLFHYAWGKPEAPSSKETQSASAFPPITVLPMPNGVTLGGSF